MPPHLPAHLCAALLPMVVLGAASWQLGKPEPWAPDAWVSELDARMNAEPDVVIVGNSIAQAAIDVAALEATLGKRVVVLTENASPGATWYTLLQFRVWKAGYRPSLVLVLGPLSHLLDPSPASGEGLAHLQRHFAEPDEVIAEKTLGNTGPAWWSRMKERRSHHREAWTAALRDIVAGPGSAEVLARVFDTDALVGELGARVIPVAEAQEALLPTENAGVAASYVPDLLTAAASNGARIVFVRPPMNPTAPAEDRVAPALEAETISRVIDGGGGWLDLRELGFGAGQFRDSRHMSASGRDRFTAALAAALEEVGALGEGELQNAEIPIVAVEVSRTGTVDPLGLSAEPSSTPCSISSMSKLGFLSNGALGRAGIEAPTPLRVRTADGLALSWTARRDDIQGCSGKWTFVGPRLLVSPPAPEVLWQLGVEERLPIRHGEQDVWWLYPGTSLDFRFDRSPSSPWSARVTLDSVGGPVEGEGLAPRLELHPEGAAPRSVVLTAEPEPPAGKAIRWSGELDSDTSGAWTLSLRAPAGGPWSIVRKIEVAHGDDAQMVTEFRSKNMPIIGSALICSAPPALTITGPPSPLGDTWLIPVAEAAPDITNTPLQLAPAGILSLAGSLLDAPVRLRVDGAPMAQGPVQPAALRRGPGYTWTPRGLQFRPEEGADPAVSPERFSVALSDERSGPRGRWVYPGDRCEGLVTARTVVRSVWVAGNVAAAPPAGAELRLRIIDPASSTPLLDHTIDWTAAERGLTLPLTAPGTGALRVELIATPNLPLVFLKTLTLSVDSAAP